MISSGSAREAVSKINAVNIAPPAANPPGILNTIGSWGPPGSSAGTSFLNADEADKEILRLAWELMDR